jgi:luciferase family oxidoreductase group 1
MIPLSVLDLGWMGAAMTASAALRGTTEVARAADDLGFRRFWVAEFHNSPITANASPPVLLAHLAAATTRIRVGSGAVLLPYHRPLLLAEQFGTLAALHPGRVDLGLGRGSGTDRLTAALLTVEGASRTPHEDRVQLLLDHLAGRPDPDGHRVRVPGDPGGTPVPVFVLGSHVESAQLAGRKGLPYVFGHHLTPAAGDDAVAAYRAAFRPSDVAEEPHVVVSVQTICGEDDEHARDLLRPMVVAGAQKGRGETVALPTVAEAATRPWTDDERAAVDALRHTQAIGSPATVAARLDEITARLGPDEVMVTASVPDARERIRSLQRLCAELGRGVIGAPPSVNGPRHGGRVGSATGADARNTEQGEPHVHAPA